MLTERVSVEVQLLSGIREISFRISSGSSAIPNEVLRGVSSYLNANNRIWYLE